MRFGYQRFFMMADYSYIESNYRALLSEIGEAARAAGRQVTLVAVTKSGTDEELEALCKAGAADIGENRPQELKRRGQLLSERGYEPRLHEIGTLQRNKVRLIIDRVALIHSLDTVELAREIDRQAAKAGRRVPVLIEINSASESAKGGVLPEEAESFFLEVRKLPNIAVSGIMTMGPACEEPEDIRPYFKLTKQIFDNIKNTHGFEGEGVLSMGMSDSYRVAIEEGATLVRVGRRIFVKNGESQV